MRIRRTLSLAGVLAAAAAPLVAAQRSTRPLMVARQFAAHSTHDTTSDGDVVQTGHTFMSRADSISWVHNRALAERARGFHVVVSLFKHHVWAVDGQDTLLSAPAAVAMGTTLRDGAQSWTFDTPRGVRKVLAKDSNPVWQPPDWLYAETAVENGLKLRRMKSGQSVRLSDGRRLVVRNDMVGVLDHGQWEALPTKEHIVFDNTLFIPPFGTKNREVPGELGKYKLALGEGYLLHGTPYNDSIGLAATHGCIRMRDEDIEWLYDHVPVGTRVYIY